MKNLIFIAILFFVNYTFADELKTTNFRPLGSHSILLAQSEGEDAYDPFVDYSEFEEASEEEADINFFKNGRFFTLGFIGGYRTFTESLGGIYDDGMTYGVFLSYFFDLRFALQLNFLTGDQGIGFQSPDGTTVKGNVGVTDIGVNLKYYLNTQNVTRGLANLNPYLVGGFSQVYRTATVSGQEAFSKEGAIAFDAGAGMEIPMMRNKMYFGIQGMFQLISFKDENSEIVLSRSGGGTTNTGIYPTGDMITIVAILGVNF